MFSGPFSKWCFLRLGRALQETCILGTGIAQGRRVPWMLKVMAQPTNAHKSPEETGSASSAKGLLSSMDKTKEGLQHAHKVGGQVLRLLKA